MVLREWAHKYVDVGWNIFPLKPQSKAPHGHLLGKTGFTVLEDGVKKASWKPLQTVRVTHELVDEWWRKEPNANIGLVCGKISGVTVIDIDTKKEEKSWEDPEKVRWEICEPTLTGITGSGGRHLFCKYVDGIGNSTKRAHPQIDVKNDGGYVVLPPSIHDKTKRTYGFDPFCPFSEKSVSMLAEFPEPLRVKLIKRQEEGMNNEDWLYIFNGVREGIDGRNHAATKVMGKLLNGIYTGTNADERFLPYMWEFMVWWNKKNQPPLPEWELKAVFKSIVKRVL